MGYFATDRLHPESDSVCVYTFIPAEKYQTYDPSAFSLEQIADFAHITNISKTWEKAPRKAALQRLNQARKKQQTKHDEFHFVINDNLTYHRLSHFKAPGNQDRYKELKRLQQKYQQTIASLDKARFYYSKATKAEKTELSREILDYEQAQHELSQAIHQQEKLIRKEENNYLYKKK